MIFLLQVFAVYRIARLVSIDNGPFDCFLALRKLVGRMAARWAFTRTLADLVNCQYCVGVWVALILALIFRNDYPVWLNWLALAGAQAALADLVEAIYNR